MMFTTRASVEAVFQNASEALSCLWIRGGIMSFLVQDIIGMNLFDGARMVAGERGALQAMRWVNIMEILDMPDSVQEHELLITTGYQMEDEQCHKDLIASLKARGACGIAIQPGYYIKAIPHYILEEADRLHFPVIELPRELTFSHIMHVLLDLIRSKEDARFLPNIPALLQRLAQWEKSGQAGEKNRAPDSVRCLIWAVPSHVSTGAADDMLRRAMNKIKQCLQTKSSRVFAHLEGRGMLLLAQSMDADAFRDLMMDAAVLLNDLGRNESLNLLAGISHVKPGQSLQDGLDEALKAAETLRRTGARRGVCPHESTDLFAMLAPMLKGPASGASPAGPLQKLLSYDREHNTAYVHTLRTYLTNLDNLCSGAEKLYIHRHTFKNRLEKIEKLSGLSLNDYYTRLHLSLELMLYDLFAI